MKNTKGQSIVVIDNDVDFTAQDFVALWNALETTNGAPVAIVEQKPKTYDATLLSIIGTAADFITIATFIGVPTVWGILSSIGSSEEQSRANHIVEETIVELSDGGQIKKITIRRRKNENLES